MRDETRREKKMPRPPALGRGVVWRTLGCLLVWGSSIRESFQARRMMSGTERKETEVATKNGIRKRDKLFMGLRCGWWGADHIVTRMMRMRV